MYKRDPVLKPARRSYVRHGVIGHPQQPAGFLQAQLAQMPELIAQPNAIVWRLSWFAIAHSIGIIPNSNRFYKVRAYRP